MTEETRKYVIVGGVGLGAIVLLVALSRKGTAAPVAVTQPGAPGPDTPPPLNIPPYPAASFPSSPITIVSAPTFNAPGTRPPFFPKTLPDVKPEQCCSECADSNTIMPLTNQDISRIARNVGPYYGGRTGRFSSFATPASGTNNQTAQFPPALFPWLYQGK